MTSMLRPSGLGSLGEVPWGTHASIFFEAPADLWSMAVPYFAAGIASGELGLWLLPDEAFVEAARKALRLAEPGLERAMADGRLEIRAGHPAADAAPWSAKLIQARGTGSAGVRFSVWPSWIPRSRWSDFCTRLEESIGEERVLVLCTFPQSVASLFPGVIELARLHDVSFAVGDERLRQRHRRQSALAALGLLAMRSGEGSELYEHVARVVAETLGTECSAVLEMLPGGGELLLRAGVGWREGFVGRHRLRMGMAWETVPGMGEAEPASELNATVYRRGRPWGVLAVRTALPRSFGSDDAGFLQSAANLMAAAIERQEAAESRRRQVETLQTFFDEFPVLISVWDQSGRLARVNRAWERALGWTLEEAQQIDLLAEVYPDPEYRAWVVDYIRRPRPGWADFRMRTHDGKFIEASWSRFAVSDGSTVGLAVDITERKQIQEALSESEARFSKLFQASPVALGMSTIDEGRIIDVNESWLELFGYRRDEVIGRTNVELRLTVEPELRRDLVRRIAEAGSVRNVEMQVCRQSGEGVDLIVSAVKVALAGEGEAWLSAMLDITDRKRAEAERDRLLESEKAARAEAEAAIERLRAIQSITEPASGPLALDPLLHEMLARLRQALAADAATVLLLDDDGKTLYVRAIDGPAHENTETLRIPVGASITGRIVAEGRPLIVDDYGTMDFTGIGGVPPGDLRAMAKSGMGAPLRIGGSIVGVVGVGSFTPRRFTEEELKLLLLVADRVAPAIERGRLLDTVRDGRKRLKSLSTRLLTAHEEERRRLAMELHDEVGQVLTAVKINLESLERISGASAPVSAHLSNAIESVDRAMVQVRDLALDLRPAVLDDLGLPAALRWYGDRFAGETGLELHLSIESIAGIEPEAETACFRVAQEALTNIARHARARSVRIDLQGTAEGFLLTVRDDGIGFDVKAARDRAIGGASLGLLGMEERVSLLRGRFEVHSRPGEGAEVSAYFVTAEKEKEQDSR
jgi:PAS domain S-box-containing protein